MKKSDRITPCAEIQNDTPSYEELVLELARQVKFNSVDEEEFRPEEKLEPKSVFEVKFEDMTEEETIRMLGRKKFWNLAILKPFVDILKYKTQTKTVSVLSLSCNSKFWKMVYKKHQYVSRLFQLAQNVKLIKCVDDSYRFNSKSFNRSKLYAWNKKQERVLLKLFKDFHITDAFESIKSINQSYIISIVNTFAKDEKKRQEFAEAKRRFNIRIAQRTCLPLSDELIAAGINERYPQYARMCKTIAEDNSMKPVDEMDYANINIKRDKNRNAISISIRKTNQYCPAKVHGITSEDRESGKILRDEILKAKFGNVYENDVKSSIYRITYLLNYGEWLDDSVDLYERIYGGKFRSEEERNTFKAPFCMQMYFNPTSKAMKARIEYRKSKTKEWNEENFGYTLIEKARDNMYNAIGKSWQSEIFLHESCIYTEVAHRLRQEGYKVVQIYDGFFTDRFLEKSKFNLIVREEAMRYYSEYINKNHISYINSEHIRDMSENRENSEDMKENENESMNHIYHINSGHIRDNGENTPDSNCNSGIIAFMARNRRII